MFKPELWQSHNEYRTIVNSLGKKLSRNNPRYSLILTAGNGKSYFP